MVTRMKCPFCSTLMNKGYVSLMGHSMLYFSKDAMSFAWGGLGKEKELILEGGYPDNYSRSAYRCSNCNAIIMVGKAGITHADTVKAGEAETEKETLKNRVRQLSRF